MAVRQCATTNHDLVDEIIREEPDATRYKHGNCRDPLWWELRKHTEAHDYWAPVAILTRRCGLCPECREARAKQWWRRGVAEGEASPRTWSFTCTMPPAWFEGRPKGDWHNDLWKEVQDAIKRARERIRSSGRQFPRYFVTSEDHTGKRTPDGLPTSHTGKPHVHMLLHEYPGSRLTNDEIELFWTRWPKFEPIPQKAEIALRVAAYKGYKLGHVEAHLERTTDPKDRSRSNAFARPAKEGVGYAMKYLFKDARDAVDTDHATDAEIFRKPPRIRASLFYGRGWAEALGLEERAKVRARITRRETKEQRAAEPDPWAAKAATAAKAADNQHCHVLFKVQGAATAWREPSDWTAWVEAVMAPIRERYVANRQQKIMAHAEAMRTAQGPPP